MHLTLLFFFLHLATSDLSHHLRHFWGRRDYCCISRTTCGCRVRRNFGILFWRARADHRPVWLVSLVREGICAPCSAQFRPAPATDFSACSSQLLISPLSQRGGCFEDVLTPGDPRGFLPGHFSIHRVDGRILNATDPQSLLYYLPSRSLQIDQESVPSSRETPCHSIHNTLWKLYRRLWDQGFEWFYTLIPSDRTILLIIGYMVEA